MSAIGGIRTIWISIRALNYASTAFGDLQKDIGGLIGSESNLLHMNQSLMKSAVDYAVAGTMMATLSSQIGMSLLNMAMQSREGAGTMAQLNQQIFLTTQALDNAAFEFLRNTGALTLLNNILKEIQKNKALDMLIMIILATVSALAALLAIVFLVSSAINILSASSLANAIALKIHAFAVQYLGISFDTLKVAVMGVLGSFMIIFTFLLMMPAPIRAVAAALFILAGAYLAVRFAMGDLSATMGAIGVGAMAAGAVSLAGQATGSFQSGGTVTRTGPVFAHAGEIVYNPSTNRPLQVGNDLGAQGGGGGTTTSSTQIVIENVNTKADVDDLGQELNQAMRKSARSRR